jgi:hypothetical protein
MVTRNLTLRWFLTVPLAAAALPAQSLPSSIRCAGGTVAAALPGGYADEMDRARGIRRGEAWSLLRSPTDGVKAAMLEDSSARAVRVALVVPEAFLTSQQSFPMPANDGPMWAGRGVSYSVTTGFALCGKDARWGAVVAPTYWFAGNEPFDQPTNPQIVPPIRQDHSPWASPFHYMPRSLDMPRRFGGRTLRRLDPGTLALWYRTRYVELGASTESEWWGPGQYNALLLSSQAAGAPRVYLRTAKPIRAKGELDVRYFLGALNISPYFFSQPEDSGRTIAGLAAVWRPDAQRGLSLGFSRLVISPIIGNGHLRHALDPFLHVGTPNALPYEDKTQYPGRDQLLSLFANWRMPDDGAEVWVEWARAELPANLADFLESPNHTQAFTAGLQFIRPIARGWSARVIGEHSQTNQSSSYRERPIGSWYTSRAVQGGFTQRGQVLGAMIGPGSISHRLGLDAVGPRQSLGLFVWRVRWDDDSFFTIPRPNGNGLCKHDVGLAWGARGSALLPVGWLEATVTAQNRINLYWQALGLCFLNEELQVDKKNLSLEFRFRPQRR